MKTRIVSLALVLALLLGLMVMPAAAAAPNAYEFLKELAINEGEYESEGKLYRVNLPLGGNSSFYVGYSTAEKELLLGEFYGSDEEDFIVLSLVTIPENRKGPYDVTLSQYQGSEWLSLSADVEPSAFHEEYRVPTTKLDTNIGLTKEQKELLEKQGPEIITEMLMELLEYIVQPYLRENGYALSQLGFTKPLHNWVVDTLLDAPTAKTHGTAKFVCTVCGEEKEDILCTDEIFTDLPNTRSWAHLPIDWAYFNGITKGDTDTTFSPDKSCTRGQVVTFLWRAAGQPKPTSTKNPFTDVKAGSFYYTAVLWAVEKGITKGLDAEHFGPGDTCTRGQVVTFLWRAAGKPAASSTKGFSDVAASSFCYRAVLWAVEKGITKGNSATSFGPGESCTRAHVVTFLFRAETLQ